MTDEQKALNYYKAGAMQGGLGEWPKPKFVPKRILLPYPVRGDGLLGRDTIAQSGEHEAHCNQFGAVSVKAENGKMLGVRLNEFDVIEWQENPHAC